MLLNFKCFQVGSNTPVERLKHDLEGRFNRLVSIVVSTVRLVIHYGDEIYIVEEIVDLALRLTLGLIKTPVDFKS